jgi:hypothetical protein
MGRPAAWVPFLLGIAAAPAAGAEGPAYAWLERVDPDQSLARRIAAPEGYECVPAADGSFGAWLRHLPLMKGNPPVRLFNGKEKPNQDAHVAVVDIDVGDRDLQQCADAVIRLRAEYLWSAGAADAVHFNFTSGDRADYAKWREGYRPAVSGSRVAWAKSAEADPSYRGFRAYLDMVFTYAGTLSLSRELAAVPDPGAVRIGDVFVQGGRPGHAVLVVDAAVHRASGRKRFLLVQSYMPAQDVHVLKNPSDPAGGPWYDADFGDALRTPEWTFGRGDLKRFEGGAP